MATTSDDLRSISDAALETGLSAHTLRYYERAGLLLTPVDRAASSHRRYSDRDLGWIRMLTHLRRTGMPIRTLREYAALARAGEGNEAERLALLEAHREHVLRELDEVRRNLEAVDRKIAIYRERTTA
ncbi:MerR family transcriptional regulator [Patulibacter sp. S7RM1-6]